jgi:hypothetical protein
VSRLQPKIDEFEQRMASRLAKINELQTKENKLTDSIFASFCSKLGISDIRYLVAPACPVIALQGV